MIAQEIKKYKAKFKQYVHLPSEFTDLRNVKWTDLAHTLEAEFTDLRDEEGTLLADKISLPCSEIGVREMVGNFCRWEVETFEAIYHTDSNKSSGFELKDIRFEYIPYRCRKGNIASKIIL